MLGIECVDKETILCPNMVFKDMYPQKPPRAYLLYMYKNDDVKQFHLRISKEAAVYQ